MVMNALREKVPETPGITFKNVDLLDSAEFRAILQPRLGKPVTMQTISEMVRDTILYYRNGPAHTFHRLQEKKRLAHRCSS